MSNLTYDDEKLLFQIANSLEQLGSTSFKIEQSGEEMLFYPVPTSGSAAGMSAIPIDPSYNNLLNFLTSRGYVKTLPVVVPGTTTGNITNELISLYDELVQDRILTHLQKLLRKHPDNYTSTSSADSTDINVPVPVFSRNIAVLRKQGFIKSTTNAKNNTTTKAQVFITSKGMRRLASRTPMLVVHFQGVERQLLANFEVASGSGHMVLRGNAREGFMRDFLGSHLSSLVAMDSGEIIAATSKFGDPRHQIDVVIYGRNFPKIYLGGGANCFLSESVYATIEVKSNLTTQELKKAISAAYDVKSLRRWNGGSSNPHSLKINSYIVAYDGPNEMSDVCKWIEDIYAKYPNLVAANRIDGVFVLGKGFIHSLNSPIKWSDVAVSIPSNAIWVYANAPTGGSLLVFFFLLSKVIGNFGVVPDFESYISGLKMDIKYY